MVDLRVMVGTVPNLPWYGTVSDPAGLTDAATTSLAGVRSLAESVGATDSVSAVLTTDWTPSAYTAGADPVGTATYDIPSSGVIYLAQTGSDSNPGTAIGAPKATLASALSAASSGSTIVIRGGSYHEGGLEIGTKTGVTIQNYPGEAVWFDGTTTLSGWTNNGNGTWTASYSFTQDRQLGKGSNVSTWGGNALRVITDQVWLDTTKLAPVADGTTPAAGQFSVNQTADTLTIGSDPTGKTVRYADQRYLMQIAGATIRGIGIRRYAPQWVEYRSAPLMIGANSNLEQVTIQDSSMDALSMGGTGITVRRCTFQDMRHSGVMGDQTAYLLYEQNVIRRGNRGDFNAQPTTAALKLTRVFEGVTIRHSYFDDVPKAAGIWFDTTVSRSSLYGNNLSNLYDGIVFEASDGGVYSGVQYYSYAVGNRTSSMTRCGIMASISGNIKIWNNDVSAAVCLWAWQDYRENTGSNPTTEGTATQSPWHCQDIQIVNNALTPTSVYYTQLRLQCNSDAAYKVPGGAMLSRLTSNWFKPQGSGLMAYISDAAGSTWSTRSTLAALESTASTYGGPLTGIMSGNYQSDTPPSSNGVPIEADVAAATGIPTGYTPPMGAIWPALALAS